MACQDWPTVDIFITCYNEPAEMVEETARAALAIDYPTEKLRVYVLDDGNAPAMRAMAERVCLEDLQTPAVRHYSQSLQAERETMVVKRSELEGALRELENLEETKVPLPPCG